MEEKAIFEWLHSMGKRTRNYLSCHKYGKLRDKWIQTPIRKKGFSFCSYFFPVKIAGLKEKVPSGQRKNILL
jgi:hypothetical protein